MQKFDHNIGFWEKTPILFVKNCRKSLKIVIITSTPHLFISLRDLIRL
jgi:hypothetical protein